KSRAWFLSAPDSSGARDAPAPSAGASRSHTACTRISRPYPVPAGGSSADLGVGSCCREPGQRMSQPTLWHTQLFACWALTQMKELLFSRPPWLPPPATPVRSSSSRQRRVSFDSSSFLDSFITGLLAMWG